MSPPPQIAIALEKLRQTFEMLGAPGVDPLTAPWAQVAELGAQLLRAPFDPQKGGHVTYALRLGALFGERFAKDTGAFWFRQRDVQAGLSMGFADRVFAFSPFGVAAQALTRGEVGQLDEAAQQLRRDHAAQPAQMATFLGPADYERFYDPAYFELIALDLARANAAWESLPGALLKTLQGPAAVARLEPQVRAYLEEQLLAPLRRLDPKLPVVQQARAEPRLVEGVAKLLGTEQSTGLTHEEGWSSLGLRMLGLDPTRSTKPSAEAVRALKDGRTPLGAFLADAQLRPEVPVGGVLGLFAIEDVLPVHPALHGVETFRLARVNARALIPVLQGFDRRKAERALGSYVSRLPRGSRLTPKQELLVEDVLQWLVRLRDVLALAQARELAFCLGRSTLMAGEQSALRRTLHALYRTDEAR